MIEQLTPTELSLCKILTELENIKKQNQDIQNDNNDSDNITRSVV